ncbi:MAG: hypothetical protein EBT81_12475 [Gammaproteobacteria bacterium]|nr:hypothetical protein [Gammaproteobacteria bacterium]
MSPPVVSTVTASSSELPHAASTMAKPAAAVPPFKNARRESFSRKSSGASIRSCLAMVSPLMF